MSSRLRDQFLLRPDIVFLNFGSFGACPKPIFQIYQEFQRELEAQPVLFLDQERGLVRRKALVREAIAAELGAFAEDIVPATNVTMALNAIVRSLPLGENDEILTTDHEYAALEKTWDFVAARTGAKIVVAKVPIPLTSRDAFTNALESHFSSRTKVLFLSHLTSPTALVFPISDIIAKARESGILTVIDGAHAPGHIDVNLNTLGADFYAGNCHKWMMAPKGAGFLWARRDLQPMLEPSIVSHGWIASDGTPQQRGPFGNSRFVDAFELFGTRDPAAWLTVPEAIRVRRSSAYVDALKEAELLAADLGKEISQTFGTQPLAEHAFQAPQMVSVELPPCNAAELKSYLYDDYHIEIPVIDWDGRTLVRLSMHVFNTSDDGARLVTALRKFYKIGK